MRVLIATDAFPPVCGGSGWSTYELAKGLRARGHELVIVRTRVGGRSPGESAEYDGFRPVEYPVRVPEVPYLRNYLKNERLTATLGAFLTELVRRERIELVHGQHVLTSPAAIAAARRAGVPAVCTVRDYWPVCYWSDLIYAYDAESLCPGCSAAMMTRCIRPRAGRAWPLALPMIPYMRANLARKRHSLAAADAIIAVSSTIARDLAERAPDIAGTRLEIIPNPIDIHGIRQHAPATPRPIDGPYALYVGKLARNKGIGRLVEAASQAGLDWPLVVVGDGPERTSVDAAARRARLDARFTGWLPRGEALGWLRHAAFLIFPSFGPESLSRVLLEAGALGIPAAAMDTGGTRDIVTDDVTGLLSASVAELAEDVRRLRADVALRQRLGHAARESVETSFDASTVAARVEALYRDVARTGGGAR